MQKFKILYQFIFIIGIIAIPVFILLIARPITINTNPKNIAQDDSIKYFPLGDSYTIGENIDEELNFPNQLVKKLNSQGRETRLLENLARTGFTTQDLIDFELPKFNESNTNFSTLLIGVNDWVQGVDKETFKTNFIFILQEMKKKVGDKFVVLTIPDFSVTPTGAMFGKPEEINNGLKEFNQIIIEETQKENIKIVDIFELSREVQIDQSLLAKDKLHYSDIEYEKWVDLIVKEVEDLL